MEQDLIAVLEKLPRSRVLVLGDLVLDRYTWGNVDRVSPEAPVMVLEVDRRESRLGAAANVAHMLSALETSATCIGVVGNDADGQMLCDLLLDANISTELVLTDPSRPTTTKERLIGRAGAQHPCQILRVDSEDRTPLSERLQDAIIAHVARDITQFDALVISDYGKGVCTPRVLEAVITAARSAEIPVLVDAMRTSDWQRYRGATLVKANRGEVEAAAQVEGRASGDVFVQGHKLCETYDVQSLTITLGGEGTAVVHRDGGRCIVPTVSREVYDVTGAGDLVMAVLAACLPGGIPLEDATRLANVATSLKLERFGSAVVTREELRSGLVKQWLLSAVEHQGVDAILKLVEDESPTEQAGQAT